MRITDEIISKSVAGIAFGSAEPFISGDDTAIDDFYKRIFSALQRAGINVLIEPDHHGSGYASYVSAFLWRRDGVGIQEHPNHTEIVGLLLYMSRLAPVAVYGASFRADSKVDGGSSSGFIEVENLNVLPGPEWEVFLSRVHKVLEVHGVELLPREPLVQPAPATVRIPTVFNPPYYVFDTLFYWED